MRHKIVFKVGPPGCGKGTQSRILVEMMDGKVVHLESSGSIRSYIGTHPWLKSELDAMGGGKLVSDDIVISAVGEHLADTRTDRIVDGFPRTVEQARFALEQSEKYDVYFILYQLEREICEARIEEGNRGRSDDAKATVLYRLDQHFKNEPELYSFIQTAMPEDRVRIQYAGLEVGEITRQIVRFLPFLPVAV